MTSVIPNVWHPVIINILSNHHVFKKLVICDRFGNKSPFPYIPLWLLLLLFLYILSNISSSRFLYGSITESYLTDSVFPHVFKTGLSQLLACFFYPPSLNFYDISINNLFDLNILHTTCILHDHNPPGMRYTCFLTYHTYRTPRITWIMTTADQTRLRKFTEQRRLWHADRLRRGRWWRTLLCHGKENYSSFSMNNSKS